VTFDDDASTNATVIDVRAPDAMGVLYRITRALTELDLDIRSAKVQTIGHHVVDAFYVRDAGGNKITDGHTLGELERAILHSLDGSTTA
jgi:[protein-PII] uridylyltransferase